MDPKKFLMQISKSSLFDEAFFAEFDTIFKSEYKSYPSQIYQRWVKGTEILDKDKIDT